MFGKIAVAGTGTPLTARRLHRAELMSSVVQWQEKRALYNPWTTADHHTRSQAASRRTTCGLPLEWQARMTPSKYIVLS